MQVCVRPRRHRLAASGSGGTHIVSKMRSPARATGLLGPLDHSHVLLGYTLPVRHSETAKPLKNVSFGLTLNYFESI